MLGRALGRLPVRLDPRTLRLSKYLRDLPAPPPACDWDAALPSLTPVYANDRIGDCAIVSAVSLMQTWRASNVEILNPALRDIVDDYSAVSGYKPATDPIGAFYQTNATDVGCDMLSVLNRWRKVGIIGRRILAFVKVDHDNIDQLRTAIRLFGGLYVGASLPRSASTNGPWFDASGKVGEWGGHAMACTSYDRLGVYFRTWGRRQRAGWQWWLRYVDECYAPLSMDWLDGAGFAPNGLDLGALDRDLQTLIR